MTTPTRQGYKIWLPLLASLLLIAGMFLGFNLQETLRFKRSLINVIERNDRLEEMIELIKDKYVDTVDNNALYSDAVAGILQHLDPHTVYIPAEELQQVNEDLEGSFSGIGVEFNIISDTMVVTSVIEDGPAFNAGVQVGDKLLKVNDSFLTGDRANNVAITRILRGKPNTSVSVLFRDAITAKLKTLAITRGDVKVSSIDASVMLDNSTGYIRISRFSANTYDEFYGALKSLKQSGLQSLILDLRQNPGGYLDAATRIADELLDSTRLLVYTEGKSSRREDYKAGRPGLFEKGKLAVLIDESSASASEILAGSIQDWDRGVILGRRSFGKGLVQEQYDLNDGSALRLTVARYYTPTGRSIQRSFAAGKDKYRQDFESRFESGELTGTDTAASPSDTMVFYTPHHRPVYSGGGIKPDLYVPYDTARLSAALLSIRYGVNFRNAVFHYFTTHRAELAQYKTMRDFDQKFLPAKTPQELTASFNGVEKAAYQRLSGNAVSRQYLDLMFKADLARLLYRNNGFYYISARGDMVIQRALNVFGGNYSSLIGG